MSLLPFDPEPGIEVVQGGYSCRCMAGCGDGDDAVGDYTFVGSPQLVRSLDKLRQRRGSYSALHECYSAL